MDKTTTYGISMYQKIKSVVATDGVSSQSDQKFLATMCKKDLTGLKIHDISTDKVWEILYIYIIYIINIIIYKEILL